MYPDIFPGIVPVRLVKGPDIIRDKKDLVLVDIVLPVIQPENSLTL